MLNLSGLQRAAAVAAREAAVAAREQAERDRAKAVAEREAAVSALSLPAALIPAHLAGCPASLDAACVDPLRADRLLPARKLSRSARLPSRVFACCCFTAFLLIADCWGFCRVVPCRAARHEAEETTKRVEATLKDTEEKSAAAETALGELKKKAGVPHGAIWWMQREVQEAKRVTTTSACLLFLLPVVLISGLVFVRCAVHA